MVFYGIGDERGYPVTTSASSPTSGSLSYRTSRQHYQSLSHSLAIHDFSHNGMFGNKYTPFGGTVCGELRAWPWPYHICTGYGNGRWTLASHLYFGLLTKSGKATLRYNIDFLSNKCSLPANKFWARRGSCLCPKYKHGFHMCVFMLLLIPRSLPPQRFMNFHLHII